MHSFSLPWTGHRQNFDRSMVQINGLPDAGQSGSFISCDGEGGDIMGGQPSLCADRFG